MQGAPLLRLSAASCLPTGPGIRHTLTHSLLQTASPPLCLCCTNQTLESCGLLHLAA